MMFLVEKIGELILVTLEDEIDGNEIVTIEEQLKEIKEDDDEVVVSLNLSNMDNRRTPLKEETRKGYNEIVRFCNRENIRIYSFVYEGNPGD
jgi:hypothetical protein